MSAPCGVTHFGLGLGNRQNISVLCVVAAIPVHELGEDPHKSLRALGAATQLDDKVGVIDEIPLDRMIGVVIPRPFGVVAVAQRALKPGRMISAGGPRFHPDKPLMSNMRNLLKRTSVP